MKIGLSETTEIKEKIVKIDNKTAIRYKVVEEVIDLEALRQEKEGIEAQLATPEPTKEELIEWGKGINPYYSTDKENAQKRIDEINLILK